MRKPLAVLVVMAMVLMGTLTVAYAQDKDAAPDAAKLATQEKAQAERDAATPYRLDFSFYELTDGKKINTRHYTLDLTVGSHNQIKIGTRVPVATGKNSPDPSFNFQYMDVGTRIMASLMVMGGGDVRLEVDSDISNLDLTTENEHNSTAPPIVRQIVINGSTLLVTGKPILIGSMDDPNSNRQFQLEVIATKLK